MRGGIVIQKVRMMWKIESTKFSVVKEDYVVVICAYINMECCGPNFIIIIEIIKI
jgi:hypothetical protein